MHCTIGIFDSGIGGLTVLKAVQEILPDQDIIYFGDLARIPYGTKSRPAIVEYSLQTVKFLIAQKVKMIIIACNTIASTAGVEIATICAQHDIAVINLIDCVIAQFCSGAGRVADTANYGNILILATPATINSNYYQRRLKELAGIGEVYGQACELFVPIIEEGSLLYDQQGHSNGFGHHIVKEIVYHYLEPFFGCDINTIILGCTHYPIIRNLIAEVVTETMGRNQSTKWQKFPVIIDPSYIVANKVKEIRAAAEMLVKSGQQLDQNYHRTGAVQFYVTDAKPRFIRIASILLGKSITAHQVSI